MNAPFTKPRITQENNELWRCTLALGRDARGHVQGYGRTPQQAYERWRHGIALAARRGVLPKKG